MKLSPLDQDVLHRAHHPRWAYAPTSGQGAAIAGGRFNRIGTPALNLSLDESTSAAEYKQDAPIADPYLMVSYQAKLPPLVDIRLLDGDWDELWNDWNCDWRSLYVDGYEPPSWLLGEMVQDAGHVGLIFPSLARSGGVNVVLYTEQLKPDWIRAHDPNQYLPKDQASWE
ncbi:MAG TPA: RES domain-containing protein [Burkholderiaceae bacterium]|nr:RES domain-containing protein [Burkholderiaceae bacterium]